MTRTALSVIEESGSILTSTTFETLVIAALPALPDSSVIHRIDGLASYERCLDIALTLYGQDLWLCSGEGVVKKNADRTSRR